MNFMNLEFNLLSESCNNLLPPPRRKSLSIDEIATNTLPLCLDLIFFHSFLHDGP